LNRKPGNRNTGNYPKRNVRNGNVYCLRNARRKRKKRKKDIEFQVLME
jgi:hypothetical protein